MRRRVAITTVLALFAADTELAARNADVAPDIRTARLVSSEPTRPSQVVGIIEATANPTTWSIASCHGCEGYFAVNPNGTLIVTAAGAAAITGTMLPAASFAPVIEAANEFGSKARPVSLTFYPDGLAAAPIVTGGPQFPRQLDVYRPAGQAARRDRYNGQQPPWNVAGIDYPVGPASATIYTPWTSFSHPGCEIGDASITCTSSCDHLTIDSVDFSVHGGAQLVLGPDCTDVVISNNKWSGANLAKVSTGVIDIAGSGTIKYNDIDGGSSGGDHAQSLIIFNRSGDSLTLQYNYFHNAANEIVGGAPKLDYRFNLISDVRIETGGHMNILQWDGGSAAAPLVTFNTLRQTLPGGAEGPQFYFNRQGTMDSPVLAHNTFMAIGPKAMSYMVHGSCSHAQCPDANTRLTGTPVLHDNYFDVSGAYGALYPRSFGGWKIWNNVEMRSGARMPESP